MKRILLIVSSLLVLTSCTEKAIFSVADSFLTNYFEMNYEEASLYCDSPIQLTLQTAAQDAAELDSLLLEKVQVASSQTRYELQQVDRKSEAGKAIISYEVYPAGSDMAVAKRMVMEKSDSKWLIKELD
ncbi:MAG: hypothetical protein GX664_00225 [Bacteroidales bacterium]|nr:hypothetical protein [Bacteroidales bacterium]